MAEASNMDSADDCIRSRLTKLAECPVCYEVMSTTEMCINGHTVCRRCRKQLQVCPLCNKSFANVRNLMGEEVSELLACKRCCNFCRGCSKFLSEQDCKRHEQCCIYRLYTCKDCKEEMCFMEIKNHYFTKHSKNVLQPYVTRELEADEALVGKMYFCLIEFNNELFWFWRKHNETNVFFGLQYCGDSDKISSYKYNFQLVSKSEKSDIEFTAPVLPDSKDRNFYTANHDYIVLSKGFMGEGAKFQISIAKT